MLEHPDVAARPSMIRETNLRTVLDALRTQRSLTASDLIAQTGLSRASVHAVCDELIARGLATELPSTPPREGRSSGRPSRTYAFDARSGFILGVDLGAHTVRVQLCDLSGELVAETDHLGPTADRTAQDAVQVAQGLIHQVLNEAGLDPPLVRALAVGVPAPVNSCGQVVRPNVQMSGLERRDLQHDFGGGVESLVLVENDANLGVLGERWRGVAKGSDDVVFILAGERLGSGILTGGRLIRGSTGEAGELDFLTHVSGVGDTLGAGWLARTMGAQAVADLLGSRPGTPNSPGALLAQVAGESTNVNSQHVVQAAVGGDAAAVEILTAVADRMARAIAVVSTLTNPEVVVLGGAIAEAGDPLLGPIRERLKSLTKTPPRVAASALGGRVVATGAVRLALDAANARLLS